MVPDLSKTIRKPAITAWPMVWDGQKLRNILISLGIEVDTPWRDLPEKARKWILLTEKQQPQLQVYPGWSHEEIQHPILRKTWPPTWVASSPQAGRDLRTSGRQPTRSSRCRPGAAIRNR